VSWTDAPDVRRQDGQSLIITVLFLFVLLAISALSLDVGHAYLAQRRLQASADAAALAGAQALPSITSADTVANQYGSGGDNAPAGVDDVQMNVTTRCLTSTPNCTSDSPDAVVVNETGSVKTMFGGLFGISSLNVNAESTACSPCGEKPLDVMLVLDRTGSMCTDSAGNPDPNCTDMQNARGGLLTFLGLMDPSLDHVGFAVLPPAPVNSSVCARPPNSAATTYNDQNASYVLVPLSSDYKTGGQLNSSSALVSTIDCVQANGSTAYANALEAAQNELVKDGRPGVQKVIIMMSDGAANTGPSWETASYLTTPCHQGIASSATIQSAGTIVYTAGYDVGHDVCRSSNGSLESPSITALQALQGIAAPGDFYNQPNAAQMNTIFSAIASDLLAGTSKLVANNS
jgi:hypothetical protein